MGTVHREAGFRFIIYVDDHAPPHVHVFGAGEAKIILKGADGKPEIVYAVAMSSNDLRRVKRIVTQHSEAFLANWAAIHG